MRSGLGGEQEMTTLQASIIVCQLFALTYEKTSPLRDFWTIIAFITFLVFLVISI